MHAEELRHLIEHDDDADSRFEAGQHRLRDEVGKKTDAQDGCDHEQDADHQGQTRGSAQQESRIAVGDHQGKVGPREDRDRRRGAHAQHARAAEHRINQHRYERGVKPCLDRKARHSGVGHGFRNDHRRRDEAGDDVRSQPFLPITEEPVEQHHKRGSSPSNSLAVVRQPAHERPRWWHALCSSARRIAMDALAARAPAEGAR